MPLTDTRLIVLLATSQRADGAIALPTHLHGATARRVAQRLRDAGLVAEISATGSLPIWRKDAEGRAWALRITKRGRAAITFTDDVDAFGPPLHDGHAGASRSGGVFQPLRSSRPHRHSKQEGVIAMLKAGTTINAIMKATGWQAHSVRGFLAGMVRNKLKLFLVSTKPAGERIYRILQIPPSG